jgi:hypothetical protein
LDGGPIGDASMVKDVAGDSRKTDTITGPMDLQPRDAANGGEANPILDGGVRDANRDVGKDTSRDAAGADVNKDATNVTPGPDRPPATGTCKSPFIIPDNITHADLVTTTAGAPHQIEMSCGANGADVVFSVFVSQPSIIYADTFGTAWDTMLQISADCPPTAPAVSANGFEGCNDDACNTAQSQVVTVVPRGTYYIIISDANGDSGPATIHFDQTVVGGGVLSQFPQGSGTLQGATLAGGRNGSLLCEASGPDDTYWWTTCPDAPGGPFSATTCNGASFDTVLTLQIPRAEIVACNDDDDNDNCGVQSTVATTLPPGAGLQSLLVGGKIARAYGEYTLTYTGP